MGNTSNIVVGAANVSVDSVDVGFTKDGVALTSNRDYLDVECDQLVGTIRKAKTKEGFTVKTTLLEATLTSMQTAWDLSTLVATGNIGDGFTNVSNEHTMGIIGPAPDSKTYTFAFYRAVSIGNAEVKWSKDSEVALELELELLKNSSGLFGTVVEA